ncbi:hypothetical protein [Vreelandella malpeensis]|uniref:Major facilitator superfamily (MFS) profile domain-containing protein n=1 Tax=Vreelandella malpeensis TaxID=1172368 RepID=A0ABS8DTJ0_9GAMM|nr:hypothetical protein [Halomonas malpeensis]MCB8889642.1 hypothetical protein [Halomonas malpeensis]
MPQLQRRRLGAGLLLVSALVGLLIALYAYLTPLTGVTGTLGALVALLACVVLAGASLALFKLNRGAGLVILRVLILLGLAGTFFAALLLHQWLLCVAMVIGLIGWIIDLASPAPSNAFRS